jgi:LEA14-like dessication related protein
MRAQMLENRKRYSEIRNRKSETLNNIKIQNPNDQNVNVLNLEHLELGYQGT